MNQKTHKTALVIIPPDEVVEPIQQIRKVNDKQYRRWMPHITLLYPFKPRFEFSDAIERLTRTCQTFQPFTINLKDFGYFRHRQKRFTLWLAPEPKQRLIDLQTQLVKQLPDCNDVNRHANGYTPHLTIGQASSRSSLETLLETLKNTWEPKLFKMDQISLIYRNDPPDDIFRVDQRLSIGSN